MFWGGVRPRVIPPTYSVPPPSGGDDTAAIQAVIDAAAADPFPLKRVVWPQTGVYTVTGIRLRSNAEYWLNGCTLRKVVNQTGTWEAFIPQMCVMSAYSVTLTNGSYYGQADNISVFGGILDATNTMQAVTFAALNVRGLLVDGLTLRRTGEDSVYWSTLIGGRNITVRNSQTLGGENVGQDGWHFGWGRDILCENCFAESGDDAYALGMDNFFTLWDDEYLERVTVRNCVAKSEMAFAVKIYSPVGQVGGSFRHRIRDCSVSVTGSAARVRNGGVQIKNRAAGTPADLIERCQVAVDITVGGGDHTGISPNSIWIEPSTDCTVTGSVRRLSQPGDIHAYQAVLVTANRLSSTGLLPATTYTATITVDGVAVPVSILGSEAPNFGALLARLNQILAGRAVVNFRASTFEIQALSRGSSSSVSISPGTLFPALNSYTGINSLYLVGVNNLKWTDDRIEAGAVRASSTVVHSGVL